MGPESLRVLIFHILQGFTAFVHFIHSNRKGGALIPRVGYDRQIRSIDRQGSETVGMPGWAG